jgi:DnaJ-class molecular chaperone
VQLKRNMKVVIPPGVSDGATMQIQGEGNLNKKRCDQLKIFYFILFIYYYYYFFFLSCVANAIF